MSDIASPILAVMDNEAHAFICFCGIMKRLGGNFRPDGQLMSVKFQHLKLLLRYSDPEFYSYLVSRGADDLFFCYRWLLLELKREFAFDDALRMLEITWSSLPPDPPETQVELQGPPSEAEGDEDAETCSGDDRPRAAPEHGRHMLRPLRDELDRSCGDRPAASAFERQASFGEFEYYTTREEDGVDARDLGPARSAGTRRQSTVDSEEDAGEGTPLISVSAALSPLSGLGLPRPSVPSPPPLSWPGASRACPTAVPRAWTSPTPPLSSPGMSSPTGPTARKPESPCHAQQPPRASSPGRGRAPPAGSAARSCSLPPPQDFGRGNPFMLFLCLSILLEHRDHIIKNCLDYNELAMHFDRLVRRHNLSRVLQRAKALFADYLQSEIWDSEEGDEAGSDSPVSTSSAAASPPLSPCSTYELATTAPSPAATLCYSSTL